MERESRSPEENKRRSNRLAGASAVLVLSGLGSFVFGICDQDATGSLRRDNNEVAREILPEPSDLELREARETIENLVTDSTTRGVDVDEAVRVLGVESAQEILAQELDDNESLTSRYIRNLGMTYGGVVVFAFGSLGALFGINRAEEAKKEQARRARSAEKS